VKFDADVELTYELKKIEEKPAAKAAKAAKAADQPAAGKGEAKGDAKSGKGKKPNRKIDYDDPWKN
jgi:hypothetical protein